MTTDVQVCSDGSHCNCAAKSHMRKVVLGGGWRKKDVESGQRSANNPIVTEDED